MLEERLKELPEILTVRQMEQVLGIEITTAYKIIYQGNFKVIKLRSKRIRILKTDLINWIKNSVNKLYEN